MDPELEQIYFDLGFDDMADLLPEPPLEDSNDFEILQTVLERGTLHFEEWQEDEL